MSNPGVRPRPVYVLLAIAVDARNYLDQKDISDPWIDRWDSRILRLVKDHLPSGSGFDCGTEFLTEESGRERLRFKTSFHHMDEYGGYCGWSEHVITIKPDFCIGFTVSVSGKNTRDIKDYIAEVFRNALTVETEFAD